MGKSKENTQTDFVPRKPAKVTPKISGTLAGRLFRTIFVVSFAATLICTLFMGWALIDSASRARQTELANTSELIKQSLSKLPTSEESFKTVITGLGTLDIRITWVSADGTVLFDSANQTYDKSENHADRPEIIAALTSINGIGQSVRLSETLGEESYYYAGKLADGTVLRLSSTQKNVLMPLVNLIVPAIAILMLLAVAAAIIARRLASVLTAPVLNINLAQPLNNEVYDELVPLLQRMDAQRTQLAKQLEVGIQTRREFTANVSHELKTPLTVISGYSELIKDGVAKPKDIQKFATLIYNEAGHMRTLVDDILIISQLDEGSESIVDGAQVANGTGENLNRDKAESRGGVENRSVRAESRGGVENRGSEQVNLLRMATEIVERLTPLADQVDVSLHLQSIGETNLTATPRVLNSMLYNLCENAVRYNRPGGSVRVTIDGTEPKELTLIVADTGIGISEDEQQRVFERFYRVDKSRTSGITGADSGRIAADNVLMGANSVVPELGEAGSRASGFGEAGSRVPNFGEANGKAPDFAAANSGPSSDKPVGDAKITSSSNSSSDGISDSVNSVLHVATKEALSGTGLGLSIVKHGSQYHGASLSLKSKLDEGTTISLVFPR
ncbi:MAG: hypothetical protein LBG97_03615 [Coriobacteriales bacterium]|jgi:two-component system phosphate regulon sensor histidine kinase PhoR|nr:hypothetical protein [Coriobacteriales bacterium]